VTDADPGGQADGPARTSRILGPGSRRHRGGTEEGARGALIAAASTLVFVVVAAWLISRSPNWPKVRDQFFNAEEFAASWPDVLRGFWVDVQMFLYGLLAIPVVALVLAVARSFRGPAFFPIRALAIGFIDVMRGIPLILLILLLGFGVPALDLPGAPTSPMFWGLVALTMSYSAYTAEIFRSGIDSVPESQRSSARAIGLTQWQTLRHAILPQAVRNVVPALMNTVVSLQKDVALVSVLGVREAVREAQIFTSRTFNYTSYVVATVLFLAFSIPLVRLVDVYSRRDRERRGKVLV
jgi:polar amino acid transport system permease protein